MTQFRLDGFQSPFVNARCAFRTTVAPIPCPPGSLEAAQKISERSLLKDATFADYIRRIASFDASMQSGAMTFKKRFAFGRGP